MVKDKIYVLKKNASVSGVDFQAGEEFHIIMDVVYMKGFPVDRSAQSILINWISNNPSLFKEKVV